MPEILVSSLKTNEFEISDSGEYTLVFDLPGQELSVVGTFALEGTDKADVTVVLHHRAPHTRAETVLKGVARDKASIRFVGRIIIDEGCGDTNSFLTEKILLLSDSAHAEAIPDLEISADDVKCSHAATISNLPEEQLFYLQSRGVPRRQAEELIVEGFLA